jgi:Antibiotic biosynthesis monooxygenase
MEQMHRRCIKEAPMLIIAGKVYVDPQERDKWVEAHYDVIKRARAAPGCLDLYVSADPVEADRVNIFELWESEERLAGWRAVADPPPQPKILAGDVQKHRISSSGAPF